MDKFCKNGTIHGLRNIADGETMIIVRVIWILITLASSVYAVINIVQTFQGMICYKTTQKPLFCNYYNFILQQQKLLKFDSEVPSTSSFYENNSYSKQKKGI